MIIARLKARLLGIYSAYLRAEQQACTKAIENLWTKYAITALQIETEREEASKQLRAYLVELGYE